MKTFAWLLKTKIRLFYTYYFEKCPSLLPFSVRPFLAYGFYPQDHLMSQDSQGLKSHHNKKVTRNKQVKITHTYAYMESPEYIG